MNTLKKLLLSSVILLSGLASLCQTSPLPSNKDRFLQRSETEKTVATVLLGVGAASLAAGVLMYNDSDNFGDAISGLGLVILGGTSTLTSFGLFYSAAKNKKKGLALTVNSHHILIIGEGNNISKMQPTLNLKFSLGKKR